MTRRPRILLFDWTAGGHHGVVLERAAEALSPVALPIVAAPRRILDGLGPGERDVVDLGDPRPAEDLSRPLKPQLDELANREVALLAEMVRRVRPDAALHLYADPVMRRLVRAPAFAAPVSVLLHFPMFHYASAFGTPLSMHERAAAWFRAGLVRRFRRRPDALSVLTFDPWAAQRLDPGRGCRVAWVPEPPVAALQGAPTDRSGCIVYGALSRHKGLGYVADALAADGRGIEITLAGRVNPDISDEMDALIGRMRAGGATVHTLFRWLDEQEALRRLAGARCAILAYPRHRGTSLVLLEAASVGTPVVASDFGLLGHLVRTHGLGETVDVTDPAALSAAIRRACADDAPSRADALRHFAERSNPARFAAALMDAVGLDQVPVTSAK